MSDFKNVFVSVAGPSANLAKMDECAICGWVVRTDASPFKYKKGANQGTDNSMLRFSVSRNEQYKDKEGNWKKEAHTSWFRVIAWGRKADDLNEVLKHNMKVRFTFRYVTHTWKDDNGVQHSMDQFEVIDFTNIMFMGKDVNLEKFANDNNLRYFSGIMDAGDAGF